MNKLHPRRLVVVLGLFALFASVPLASNEASVPAGRYRFFVKAENTAEIRRLSGWLNKNDYDVAGIDLQRGTLEVITSDTGVSFLKANGLTGRLVHAPVLSDKSGRPAFDPRYLDPAKVAKRMADLHAKYPTNTRVIEIGRSLNDLPILGLIISTTLDTLDPKFHQKPTVLVDGMHHAREIMTPEVVFDIGETLLSEGPRSVRARTLLEGMNIVLVPMLNVDGNTRVWHDDNYWRKNAHAEGSSVFGVDINRNYPYRWADCGGSSDRKFAQDYHGASAASEPETKALMNVAEQVRPMASLSYHSFSELVLYPYGCDGEYTSENTLLAKLGKEMAELLPSDSGRGHYTPGTPWDILYGVDGDSMGYMFSTFGATAFTFEVNEEFQPPYALREPTLKKHRIAWGHFFDEIQKQLLTIHVVDARGKPVDAQIDFTEIPHTKGERSFTTNLAGNYFKVLLPGTYTIRTTAKSGATATTAFTMGEEPAQVTVVLK